MSRAIRIVFLKEVLENLRDRRVVSSAFFFGVLLAPAIFAFMTTITSNRIVRTQDEPVELALIGAEHAPNLVDFLQEHGVEVERLTMSTERAIQAVRDGEHDLVLAIEPEYAERLQTGEPAPVELIVDTANSQTAGVSERTRRILEAYSSQLATLRLLVRGISPAVVQPIEVRVLDVATPAGRSLLVLGMMTYFCLMSMLMGGFYLAVDTTAGERERGSLEPLLALPVQRSELILGKILAASAFMAVSLLLTLISFGVALAFVPLETLGMSANFGPQIMFKVFLAMVVFVPLGAGLMSVVASFTRSTREAQTWLSFVLMVPIAPIMFAVINSARPTAGLMAIPSLSQHLLVTSLLRGDQISMTHVAISVGTTLAAGLILIAIAIKLYQREAILG